MEASQVTNTVLVSEGHTPLSVHTYHPTLELVNILTKFDFWVTALSKSLWFTQTAEGEVELENEVKPATGRPLNFIDFVDAVEKEIGAKNKTIWTDFMLAHEINWPLCGLWQQVKVFNFYIM